MFLLPDTPLDSTPLQMNVLSPEDIIINKALFSTLTTGKGPTDLLKTLAEFDATFPFLNKEYNKRLHEMLVPALDLAVRSCTENLKLSSGSKKVGIDGAWNAPKNARFCVVDLIDCDTRKIVDFQIVSSVNLQIDHPNFSYIPVAPNLFEYFGVEAIAGRTALKEGTTIFAHDGDVKIKDLLINKKGLKLQEVLDANHKAKSLFYSAAQQNSPLNGLYKVLRGNFLAVLKKYPPHQRFDKFNERVHKYVNNHWKNRNKETCMKALEEKILETKEIYPKLNPSAHTNHNEAFHSLKNHFAPKSIEFKLSWCIRVVFALIEYNHPYTFITIIRNFLQAPPPMNQQSIQSLQTIMNKKMYDKRRRQDPLQKEITKMQKFKKQPTTFTSPFRHKQLDEDLPKEKMTKVKIFPNSKISLRNWKNKIYFVQTNNKESMTNLIDFVQPPIYRLSKDCTSCIMISSVKEKIDSFANAPKESIVHFHLITDDSFLDDISVVNDGTMYENEDIVAHQKAKKELLGKKVTTKNHHQTSKGKVAKPHSEVQQGVDSQYSTPAPSPARPIRIMMSKHPSFPDFFEGKSQKTSDAVSNPIQHDDFDSPITEPLLSKNQEEESNQCFGFIDFDEEEEQVTNEKNFLDEDRLKNIENENDSNYSSGSDEDFEPDTEEVRQNLLFSLYGIVEENIFEKSESDEDEPFDESNFDDQYDEQYYKEDHGELIFNSSKETLSCGEEYPFSTWPPTPFASTISDPDFLPERELEEYEDSYEEDCEDHDNNIDEEKFNPMFS